MYLFYILTEQEQHILKIENNTKAPISVQRAKKAYYNRTVQDREVRINSWNKAKDFYLRNKEEIAKRWNLKRDAIKWEPIRDITNIPMQVLICD